MVQLYALVFRNAEQPAVKQLRQGKVLRMNRNHLLTHHSVYQPMAHVASRPRAALPFPREDLAPRSTRGPSKAPRVPQQRLGAGRGAAPASGSRADKRARTRAPQAADLARVTAVMLPLSAAAPRAGPRRRRRLQRSALYLALPRPARAKSIAAPVASRPKSRSAATDTPSATARRSGRTNQRGPSGSSEAGPTEGACSASRRRRAACRHLVRGSARTGSS